MRFTIRAGVFGSAKSGPDTPRSPFSLQRRSVIGRSRMLKAAVKNAILSWDHDQGFRLLDRIRWCLRPVRRARIFRYPPLLPVLPGTALRIPTRRSPSGSPVPRMRIARKTSAHLPVLSGPHRSVRRGRPRRSCTSLLNPSSAPCFGGPDIWITFQWTWEAPGPC